MRDGRSPCLSEAERSEVLIRELCVEIKVHFLELGVLLARNLDNGLWAEHHGSFKEFVETLKSLITETVKEG